MMNNSSRAHGRDFRAVNHGRKLCAVFIFQHGSLPYLAKIVPQLLAKGKCFTVARDYPSSGAGLLGEA